MTKLRFAFPALCLASLLITGCATQDQTRVKEAMTAPLNDLNLVHAPIPDILIQAEKQPYAVPGIFECSVVAEEILQLDAVLGPDLDAPESASEPSLIDRGTAEAKDAAVRMIRSTTQSVIPYRRWVRKLSGAERYSKQVSASIAAGTVRRAFLKGLMVWGDCRGTV